MKRLFLLTAALLLFGWCAVMAESPPPPADSTLPALQPATDLLVQDQVNDEGRNLVLAWTPSGSEKTGLVKKYTVERATAPDGPFAPVGDVPAGTNKYQDKWNVKSNPIEDGKNYWYRISLASTDNRALASPIFGPVQSQPSWFHTRKWPVLIFELALLFVLIYFIRHARKGKELYIRPIAGINAVDEAIGRATEMGRPILFVPGMDSYDSLNTLAAYTILGRVARKAAEFQTRIIVPCRHYMVLPICQEVVREGCLKAGRPDFYNPNDIFFVTTDQFGYVGAVNGIMLREKTATNFYMGGFYAESLLLAETGSLAGSIQIAGTDAVTQIPFFIASCDYTLIGEELYAASAYLSREPLQLGSLKGQDYAKALIMIVLLVGFILTTFGWLAFKNFLNVT